MIEFKSVSKTYPDGTKAVTELDLVVPSDQITVLVGPSGCGKTTTLRMINRMIEPTSGSIEWDGKPIKQMRKTALRRQMGYALQHGGLFPHRTVLENIGTVPTLLRWKDAKIAARAKELLELVGLEPKLADRFPAQLSGGQQQRVGVARALAADPDLLLMDEPFSAVDPVVRADLQQLVKKLQRELNKTIVLITHDIDEAINMGDQVAVLRPGGVLAQFATPAEVLDHPADDFVRDFVGRDRGYRSLTFAEDLQLEMSRVRTVRNADSAFGPRDDLSQPVLVVDAQAHPLGWADPTSRGRVLTLGTVFEAKKASLREVLESSLTSPVGLAVAVDDDGRYAGVVSGAAVMEETRRYRGGIAVTTADRTDEENARIEAERLEVERLERERVEAEKAAEEAEAERRRIEEMARFRGEKGRKRRRGRKQANVTGVQSAHSAVSPSEGEDAPVTLETPAGSETRETSKTAGATPAPAQTAAEPVTKNPAEQTPLTRDPVELSELDAANEAEAEGRDS